ncbi:Zn-dependent exopeptidase [Pseudovirgaria hyperparasitica]|uniref:Zn-dependent exopeptidase n=1 Tax=Pseudovirgaria hyperparasitica TaxID=470096 RepID=A0A6A6WJN9_9PEZI|nr:Zn-dependent exopeptidase [Pseudovirgaria hyperparasitica]KAF2762514.1 Zn-dependent exopeptidase [Pseudovirgaria hyperparasitica]
MAQWTADRWTENGIQAHLAEYVVYLNYPVSKALTLTLPNGTVFTPDLEEAVLAQDETTSYPNRIPTFHGYSASGNASAEYVYVGRGQQVDFERLLALGISLEGKIALAKYGGPFRGLKVKNSQEYGMIGTIIFSDPGDDGNITEANGYAPYPDGPARNPTQVQKGSVEFLSIYPGDPTTPGYPSKHDSPRADASDVLPHIPSLPISYGNAIPFLAALDGHGVSGEEVNRTKWIGALNVTYSTGPAPGAVIDMHNLMEDAITPIWDVIDFINGTDPEETILIGNHRDAWLVGGAADPNSGSAVLVEMSKAFGKLLQTGWKPRRNIVFASWDAEEYGIVGSTEWVEEFVNPWLTNTAVTYLNIDIACSGPRFDVSASPELHTLVQDTMKKVLWPLPGGAPSNQTLYDIWTAESGEIGVLGSGSDYTSFVHRGIGAVDMGAGGGGNDPVYPYHSNYDTYHWMTTYGDPGYHVHAAVGQYASLLLYHLSTDALIPFDITAWGTELDTYLSALTSTLESTGAANSLDTLPLSSAITYFQSHITDITSAYTNALVSDDAALISIVNAKLRDFQRGFISQGGLPGREFYQHAIYAPGLDTGYAPVTFPGITEAVDKRDFGLAAEWVEKTARAIRVAADILKT